MPSACNLLIFAFLLSALVQAGFADDALERRAVREAAQEVANALADRSQEGQAVHPIIRHLRAERVPADSKKAQSDEDVHDTEDPFKFLTDRPMLETLLDVFGVNPRRLVKALQEHALAEKKAQSTGSTGNPSDDADEARPRQKRAGGKNSVAAPPAGTNSSNDGSSTTPTNTAGVGNYAHFAVVLFSVLGSALLAF